MRSHVALSLTESSYTVPLRGFVVDAHNGYQKFETFRTSHINTEHLGEVQGRHVRRRSVVFAPRNSAVNSQLRDEAWRFTTAIIAAWIIDDNHLTIDEDLHNLSHHCEPDRCR